MAEKKFHHRDNNTDGYQQQQQQHQQQSRPLVLPLEEEHSGGALVGSKIVISSNNNNRKREGGQIVFASFFFERHQNSRTGRDNGDGIVRKSCNSKQHSPQPQFPQQQQEQQQLELQAARLRTKLYNNNNKAHHHQPVLTTSRAAHHHRGKVGVFLLLGNRTSKQDDDDDTVATTEVTSSSSSSSLFSLSCSSNSRSTDSSLHDLSMFATMLVSEELEEENNHRHQQQQQHPIISTNSSKNSRMTSKKSRRRRAKGPSSSSPQMPPPLASLLPHHVTSRGQGRGGAAEASGNGNNNKSDNSSGGGSASLLIPISTSRQLNNNHNNANSVGSSDLVLTSLNPLNRGHDGASPQTSSLFSTRTTTRSMMIEQQATTTGDITAAAGDTMMEHETSRRNRRRHNIVTTAAIRTRAREAEWSTEEQSQRLINTRDRVTSKQCHISNEKEKQQQQHSPLSLSSTSSTPPQDQHLSPSPPSSRELPLTATAATHDRYPSPPPSTAMQKEEEAAINDDDNDESLVESPRTAASLLSCSPRHECHQPLLATISSSSKALVQYPPYRNRTCHGSNNNHDHDILMQQQSSVPPPSPLHADYYNCPTTSSPRCLMLQKSPQLSPTLPDDGVGASLLLLSPACIELQSTRIMENTSPLSTSWCGDDLDDSYLLFDNVDTSSGGNNGGAAGDDDDNHDGRGGGEVAADQWTTRLMAPCLIEGKVAGAGDGIRKTKSTSIRSLDQRLPHTLVEPSPTNDDQDDDNEVEEDNAHNGRFDHVTKERQGFRSSGDDVKFDGAKAEFPHHNDSFKENSPNTQQSSRRIIIIGDSVNQTHLQTKQQQQQQLTRTPVNSSSAICLSNNASAGFDFDESFDIDDSGMLRLMAQGTESVDSGMYSSSSACGGVAIVPVTTCPTPTSSSTAVSRTTNPTTTSYCATNSITSRRQGDRQELGHRRQSLEDEMPQLEFALESFAQEAYFDWRNDTLESDENEDCDDDSGNDTNKHDNSEVVAVARSRRQPPSRTDATTLLLPTPSLRDEIQQEPQLLGSHKRREPLAASGRPSVRNNNHSGSKGKPAKLVRAGVDFSPDSTSSDLQVWDLDSDDAIDNAGNVDWHRLDGPTLRSSPTSSASSCSLTFEKEEPVPGGRRRSRTDAGMLLLPTPSLREELDEFTDTTIAGENSSRTDAKNRKLVPPPALTMRIRNIDNEVDAKKECNKQSEVNPLRSLSRSSKGSDRTVDLELECSCSIVKFNERSVLQPIAEEPVHAIEDERTAWRAQVDDLLLKNRQLEERLERLTYDTRIKTFQDTFDELRLVKIKNEQLQQQVDSLRHVQVENERLEQEQAMQTALVAEMAKKFVNIQNFTQTLQTKLQVSEQRNMELEKEVARLSSLSSSEQG